MESPVCRDLRLKCAPESWVICFELSNGNCKTFSTLHMHSRATRLGLFPWKGCRHDSVASPGLSSSAQGREILTTTFKINSLHSPWPWWVSHMCRGKFLCQSSSRLWWNNVWGFGFTFIICFWVWSRGCSWFYCLCCINNETTSLPGVHRMGVQIP